MKGLKQLWKDVKSLLALKQQVHRLHAELRNTKHHFSEELQWVNSKLSKSEPTQSEADENVSLPERKETWSMEFDKGKVHLHRAVEGRTVESYCPLTPAEASVYVAAIIQDFEPPRGLLPLDRPSA